MSSDRVIPIVEEQAHVTRRRAETERVSVRTSPVVEDVLIREMLSHEHVEVTRVAVDREVDAAPAIRTEGDVTIVPVLEERLVVEKRLFVVEELHLRRTTRSEQVELPTTLRRMHVEVTREDLNPQEEH